MYSYWGIHLITFIFFFILNLGQTILETINAYKTKQAPITIICVLGKDLTTLESVGFIVVFLLLAIGVITQGIIFVRAMASSQKKKSLTRWDDTLYKTKVLLIVAVIDVIIIVSHDVVFNFVLDNKVYKYFPLESFIIFVAEMLQMITVMAILAGRQNIKNYILFRPIKEQGSQSQLTGSGTNGIGNSHVYFEATS
eukprot:gene7227-8397_t